MSNRIDSLLSGVGTPLQVSDAHAHNAEHTDYADAIKAAAASLVLLTRENDGCKRAATAIACSLLNLTFGKQGWIVSVDNVGYVTHTYFSGDNERKVFASLLAD